MQIPWLIFVGIGVVVCCAGCRSSVAEKDAQPSLNSRPDPKVVGLFGGPEGFAVLTNPARVEAFRVESDLIWSVLTAQLQPDEWGKVSLSVGTSPEEIKAT